MRSNIYKHISFASCSNLCKYRFRKEFLIDFACIPNTKQLDSYLQYLIRELEDIANNKINVEVNDVNISFNVHLLGSFGDIPSVAEVNFLNSHTSKLGCRFCTIEGECINHVVCFSKPTSHPNRIRIKSIEEYKNGNPAAGIKKPSLFRNLPSFIHPTFIGLDEFHIFGQNIGPQIKKFFSLYKESIFYLKPSYCELIGDCISENAKFMPLIFEGNLVDVFRYSGKSRGVDWLVFLKYFVGTVLLDYVGYNKTLPNETIREATEALQCISLICSVSLQQNINDEEIQKLDNLVTLWHNFLRKYMPPTLFTINQHYLEHLGYVIKNMGPLRQISCRTLERRIHLLKSEINACSNIEQNAENIII